MSRGKTTSDRAEWWSRRTLLAALWFVLLSFTLWPLSIARAERPDTPNTPELLDLVRQARAERVLDHIAAAESLVTRALQMVESDPDPTPEAMAAQGELLVISAGLAADRGDLTRAATLFERSHDLLVQQWGPDHPHTVEPLLGLADGYEARGTVTQAGELYRRAIAILEQADQASEADLADALIRYACHLASGCDYDGAESAFRRALALLTQTYGDPNPEAAVAMTHLGDTLKMLGRDTESLQMVRDAVRIAEATVGPDHTKTATALGGLAHALLGMRKNTEAERLFRRALAILETVYGTSHPAAAQLRGSLGRCLEVQKRFEEAETEFQTAITELTQIFGPRSFQVALVERRLGLLYLRLRRVEEAYDVLCRCTQTLEWQFGPHHPFLCMSLKGLVESCLFLGNPEEARKYALQAVASYQHVYGGVHTEVLMGLRFAALVELLAGNHSVSLEHAMQACEIGLALQEKIYAGASDHEALFYSGWARKSLEDTALGILALTPAVSDTVLARFFSLTVRAHGQVLDRMAQRRRYLAAAADEPGVSELCRAYLQATQEVAALSVNADWGDAQEDSVQLIQARTRLEETERSLSQVSERFRAMAAFREVERDFSPRSLATVLEPGATLVQFVRFAAYEITPAQLDSEPKQYASWRRRGEAEYYAAFRLSLSAGGEPELAFIDLGRADELHDLIERYRRCIDGVGLNHWPSARDEAEYRRLARALYARLWEPLGLSSTQDPASPPDLVFLTPTGQLNLVDFNTLITPANDLIIERWRLHYLSSARDLLRYTRTQPASLTGGMLAVGNPLTNQNGRPIAESSGTLPPLPGAEVEASRLADLYSRGTGQPATLLLGAEATETAVKSHLAQSGVIHLAAHGFFYEPTAQQAFVPERDYANPLLRSGIVLAGGDGGDCQDDGLLTAQEIVGFDLRGARWVVLSACGSALGRILPGEGLFGLRRAFEMAGARTVVTALWQIHDPVAQDLMERIYSQRLAGVATVDAVRQAQLARLTELRQRRDRIHPALWGGIVAEGDWR